MAVAAISDLWSPDIWVRGMREKQATLPSILNSGICVTSAEFDAIATGAGTIVNVPFYKDSTDQADAIQVQDTAPTIQAITTGTMKAAILNRVTANGVTALAAQVSGSDPVAEFSAVMAAKRLKQRNTTLIALLRGAFASLGASGATAALDDVRVDSFDESGTDATSDQTFSSDLFITAKALMGELADELQGGAMLVHPNVLASLERQDKESFAPGVVSAMGWTVRTYRGVPVFTSELLARAGSSNGYVYDSYLFAKGVVARGEKAQIGGTPGNPVLDVASLNYTIDTAKNNSVIYDRTRHILHLNGMSYDGTPSGQSATDAELGTAADWSYKYQTANRAGIVCIRTNK